MGTSARARAIRGARGGKQKENNGAESDGRRDEGGKSGWCGDNSSITGLFTRIMYSRGSRDGEQNPLFLLVFPPAFSLYFVLSRSAQRTFRGPWKKEQKVRGRVKPRFYFISTTRDLMEALGWWRTYESSTSKSHYLRKFKLPSLALALSSRFSLWRGERTRWNDSKANFSGLLSLFFLLSFLFFFLFRRFSRRARWAFALKRYTVECT